MKTERGLVREPSDVRVREAVIVLGEEPQSSVWNIQHRDGQHSVFHLSGAHRLSEADISKPES